ATPEKIPVDVIFVIDASGSMFGEAAIVQDNMNQFSQRVIDEGVDLRTVVITRAAFVTVPPPLGVDPERYLFLESRVESNDALVHLLKRYPDYKDFLRPNAETHFVAVTDDESWLTPSCFHASMTALLNHDFVLHSVASEDTKGTDDTLPAIDGTCDCAPAVDWNTYHPSVCGHYSPPTGGRCATAARVGSAYNALAKHTGGLTHSICSTDWTVLFDRLTETVVESALPCALAVPEPPDGFKINLSKLEVRRTLGDGQPVLLERSPDDTCSTGEWYLDETGDQSMIQLCQAACEAGREDEGTIEITWPCGVPIL
ncbi:MAG: VWA domain-containing protein, partial [Myxococcales bacterium]|nr:VWA domain-containing protein [Myxococcales bacterium]